MSKSKETEDYIEKQNGESHSFFACSGGSSFYDCWNLSRGAGYRTEKSYHYMSGVYRNWVEPSRKAGGWPQQEGNVFGYGFRSLLRRQPTGTGKALWREESTLGPQNLSAFPD